MMVVFHAPPIGGDEVALVPMKRGLHARLNHKQVLKSSP